MLSDVATIKTQSCYDEIDLKRLKNKTTKEYQKSNGFKDHDDMINDRTATVKESNDDLNSLDVKKNSPRQELIWKNIIAITLFHIMAVYCYLTFPYLQRWKTAVWAWLVAVLASFGVGAGVHRLWTHRSYKAKTPLRIILLCCYSTAGMNSIYDWVRDHRVHHKFSETDADPHNSGRGFFFSHVGWLMMRKHPEVLKKGRLIKMNDILADPVVVFDQKYSILLKILFCYTLPTLVPVYFWNEDWYYAIISQIFMRYSYVLNATWCVNSVAHMFGWRPYDRMIAPTENILISYATGGEGWHNYHHVFPWDYKASEIGHYMIDLSTIFIDTFAKIGWAYDLKEPSPELIRSVISKKRRRFTLGDRCANG